MQLINYQRSALIKKNKKKQQTKGDREEDEEEAEEQEERVQHKATEREGTVIKKSL